MDGRLAAGMRDYPVTDPPASPGRSRWMQWLSDSGLAGISGEAPRAWTKRKGFHDAPYTWSWSSSMLDVVSGYQDSKAAFEKLRRHMLDDARAAALLMDQADRRVADVVAPEGLEAVVDALRAERAGLQALGARDCRSLEAKFDPVTLVSEQVIQGCSTRTVVTVRALPGDTGRMSTCDCFDPRPDCAARLACVTGAIDAVVAPGAEGEELRRVLRLPPWERSLMVLDRALGGESGGEVTLGWALTPLTGRVEAVRVESVGKRVKITLWPADSARATAAASALPADVALARLWRGRGHETPFGAALVALDGHPNVYLWPAKTPIRVKASEVQLDLLEREQRVELAATVGGVALADRRPEGTAVVEGDRVSWWTTPYGIEYVRIPERLSRLLAAVKAAGPLPLEALPGLLARLPRIAQVAPVSTAGFAGLVEVESHVAPLVMLEGLPGGALAVGLRVRPIAGGPVFEPGAGAETVVAAVEGAVLTTKRALASEESAAADVIARLELPEPDASGDWVITSPEDALALVERLPRAGAEVQWRQRPVRVAGTLKADGLRVNVAGAGRWFQVAGEATVGGGTVSVTALLEAARLGRSFVQVGEGQWARIEDGLRRQLAALARNSHAAPRGQDASNLAGIHAGLVEELGRLGARVEGDARWAERLARIDAARTLTPTVPSTLTATMRPYQEEGFRWLTRLLHWAGGAVLADDMGLGKTIQALAVLLDRAALGPALVVAPTSVTSNWTREAAAFAPSLAIRLHRGGARDKTLGALGPGDVVVVSYDIAVLDQEHWKHRFATVVFDEAHALKNASTKRSRAAVEIDAECRIALTGTPLENRVGELWSLFRAVLPGVFGSAEQFRDRWVNPIERDNDVEVRAALARLVQPFVLRRTKAEVAKDLPARTEVRVDVELGRDARARYEDLRAATARALSGLDDTPPEKRRFLALVALTRLRQLACHPGLIDREWSGGSPKIDALVALVSELKAEGRRALVFSQFTEHLKFAAEALTAAGITFRSFDGSTPAAKRDAEVRAFMGGDGDAFLLSVKAGGVGLNLTAASDVVILDPWWNPAVENQAADRAHRIGQKRAVTIYRLVATDTVEEKMLALQEDKRELVAAVLAGTGDGGSLSLDEIIAVLEA